MRVVELRHAVTSHPSPEQKQPLAMLTTSETETDDKYSK